MKRIALGLLAVALGVLIIAPAQAAAPKLVGTVGPGFTITLIQGRQESHQAEGGQVHVRDRGQGVDSRLRPRAESGGKWEKQLTSVPFVGTKTVTVALKKGKWKYYCAPHESTMSGFFTVT